MGEEVSDVVRLFIPMSANFNDGQHYRAAIEAVLEERLELGIEAIAVVFFPREDHARTHTK
jgi:DNA sulfur modification protein DndB